MPRIDPAPDVRGPLIAKMLGRRPEVLGGFLELDAAFRHTGLLDAALLEDVRRTTAADEGCEYCASLGEPRPAGDERTRAALGFAHAMVNGADTADDDLVDALRPHFSEEEIVELVAWTCIVCIGGQKFGAALGLEGAPGTEVAWYQKWVSTP